MVRRAPDLRRHRRAPGGASGPLLLLLLANASFVLGEFSLIAIDRGRLERLARTDRRAGGVLSAVERLIEQLSGAQLRARARPAAAGRGAAAPPVLRVAASQRVVDVFEELRRASGRLAVVVDDGDQPAGIVTLEDLLQELLGE